jgi:hypothetical protein
MPPEAPALLAIPHPPVGPVFDGTPGATGFTGIRRRARFCHVATAADKPQYHSPSSVIWSELRRTSWQMYHTATSPS